MTSLILLATLATLAPVAPVAAETSLARVAVCEALMRVQPTASPEDPRVALSAAATLIGTGPAVSAEAALFDVDTTLGRIRRFPDGLSHHSASAARLVQINLDLEDPNVITMVHQVTGADDIARELSGAVARARATDAAVKAELTTLYPPNRTAVRSLKWVGALSLVPPAALAVAGYPAAAVVATPLVMTPPLAMYLLYLGFARAGARTKGLVAHAAAIERTLTTTGPDFVMHSGSLRVPYRVSRALTDGRVLDLRDMAIVAENGVRLPFEASRAETAIEMREVFYDSIFVRTDGAPRWVLILRSTKTPKPATRRE